MRLGNPAHGLNDIRQTGIELGLHNTKDNPTTQLPNSYALILGALADHRSVKTKVQKNIVRVVCNGSENWGPQLKW